MRIVRFIGEHILAFVMLAVLVLALPSDSVAQELPRAVPDPTAEIQPATFPLRVDATAVGDILRLYLQCGAVSAPFAVVQGGFITTTQFPVVSLCERGLIVIAARDFYVPLPLDSWMQYDREGHLGGVLVCVGKQQTGFAVYTEAAHLPQSCADLEESDDPQSEG